MFFSAKQGLRLGLKNFFQVPMLVYFSSNLNSCSERLGEGMGQSLRKDDSCDSFVAI